MLFTDTVQPSHSRIQNTGDAVQGYSTAAAESSMPQTEMQNPGDAVNGYNAIITLTETEHW